MRAVVALALVGCGRVDFQPRGDASRTDDSRVDDSRVDDGGTVQPIAYWRLDEATGLTTTDAIGGINGTLFAGLSSTVPTWTAGELGAAVAFTGDGDAIYIDPGPIAANLAQLSIVAWVKIGLSKPGITECVLDHGDGTVGWAFLLEHNVAGDMGFSALFGTQAVERYSIGGMLPAGVWKHVALTWDGGIASTGIRAYVDGSEVSYAAGIDGLGARPDDSNVSLTINCSASTSLNGVIDDVKLYDRVLTPAQVMAL